MTQVVADRIERLAHSLRDFGFDAYLATTPIDMGYLHGFREGSGERFMALCIRKDGNVRLICPSLSRTQAERCGIEDIRDWNDGADPMAHVVELAQDWNLRSAMIAVDNEMLAAFLLDLQRTIPAALFKPGRPVIAPLMRCKDASELDAMQRAATIADDAFDEIHHRIRPGMTELQVETLLRQAMAERGGIPTFCIAATGANGAEPHHLSDLSAIAQGDVIVIDFGCEVDGYNSDITRMVVVGEPNDEVRKVHGIVYEAFVAGCDAGRPGVPAQDVDAAARKVIEDAGYGEFFVHRTGHGIGLRVHEDPYIVRGNGAKLELGNCYSVEPGIYLPGKFGVRIENILFVDNDGAKSFNRAPSKDIIVVG